MKKSIRDAVQIESLEVPGLGLVKEGLKVSHPAFGRGTVVSITEFPPYCPIRHSIGVEFSAVGFKALAPEHAKLRARLRPNCSLKRTAGVALALRSLRSRPAAA